MAATERRVVIAWSIEEFHHLDFVRWMVESEHLSEYLPGDTRRSEVAAACRRGRLDRLLAASRP